MVSESEEQGLLSNLRRCFPKRSPGVASVPLSFIFTSLLTVSICGLEVSQHQGHFVSQVSGHGMER